MLFYPLPFSTSVCVCSTLHLFRYSRPFLSPEILFFFVQRRARFLDTGINVLRGRQFVSLLLQAIRVYSRFYLATQNAHWNPSFSSCAITIYFTFSWTTVYCASFCILRYFLYVHRMYIVEFLFRSWIFGLLNFSGTILSFFFSSFFPLSYLFLCLDFSASRGFPILPPARWTGEECWKH